jgi:copper homeostasis protein CutC
VHVKAQLAEQRKTAKKKTAKKKTAKKKTAKTRPLKLYEAPSSQGTTPSPGVRRRCQRDWGGSHRDPRPVVRPRGSRVSEENEDAESVESIEY